MAYIEPPLAAKLDFVEEEYKPSRIIEIERRGSGKK
jgi:hypothetical protein